MEVNLPVMKTQRRQNTDEVCSVISWKVTNLPYCKNIQPHHLLSQAP